MKAPGDGEGQGSLACCSPWGRKELDKIEWLNNNKCKSRVIKKKKLWTSKVRILSLMCILLPYKSPLLSTPPSINMPPVSDISRIGNRWEGMSGSGKVYLTELKVSGQRRQWHPTLVLLPGNSHGQRSLVGCSPWGREELDPTVQLHFHFSLSRIGEGNGNPLQCSCLENPRDGGAW